MASFSVISTRQSLQMTFVLFLITLLLTVTQMFLNPPLRGGTLGAILLWAALLTSLLLVILSGLTLARRS